MEEGGRGTGGGGSLLNATLSAPERLIINFLTLALWVILLLQRVRAGKDSTQKGQNSDTIAGRAQELREKSRWPSRARRP